MGPGMFREAKVELPPRARRILYGGQKFAEGGGTTSACAENTAGSPPSCRMPWNYLRVRGEYSGVLLKSILSLELPPRARRIRFAGLGWPGTWGTTSACAENTARLPHAQK